MTNKPVEPPAHFPRRLKNGMAAKKIQKDVVAAINDGLDIPDAFLNAGIPRGTYKDWKRWYIQDVQNGYTGTQLIDLFDAAIKADTDLHREISSIMLGKAREGDTKMIMYVEDNRFGAANKRKNNIDVSGDDKGNVQINIINMSSVEKDEVEEIEVYGECRDDSDSTEMD